MILEFLKKSEKNAKHKLTFMFWLSFFFIVVISSLYLPSWKFNIKFPIFSYSLRSVRVISLEF